jgi:HPt (histidine-containing phosphotransfer) domain-containing protein
MVNETDFDAVLLVVQMPEMDGIEATQLIRQKPQYEKLPIIAMTAHAMSGDRERCLKAGMNDYITKPIDLNQLFSALKKWIKPKSPLTPFYQSGESLLQKGVGEDEKNLFLKEIEKNEKTFLQKRVGENGENCDSVNKTGAKSPQTQELKFKDVLPNELPDIDMATALKRLGGNRRLYHHLLGDFYLNYQDVATKIYHALKNDELKTALHLVHTVKGVAGNLGIQNLQKISETVEITLGAGDKMTSGLLKQFEITVTEVMKTLACLNNMDVPSEKNFEGCETEKCGATDIAILTPLLQDMAKLLDDGSVQAIKCLPEIKKTLGDHFQTEYQKMEEQLNIFEFEEVLKILAKIAKILNITL